MSDYVQTQSVPDQGVYAKSISRVILMSEATKNHKILNEKRDSSLPLVAHIVPMSFGRMTLDEFTYRP